MTEEQSARTVARRVAAFGLPGSEEREPVRIAEERWPATLAELDREKLTGLAVAAAEAGALSLNDEQVEDLLERHREAMAWALGLERTLLRLAEAFAERGIGFVVLKGPALAHTIYPDPSWRLFGDLDLLVRTRDWRRALAALADLGLRRRLPEPRRGFDERFGKAAVHRTPDGQEIDLHRTLALGPFGVWIQPDELFQRTDRFHVAGATLQRLDDTGLLAHACVHSALGDRPALLLSTRDVAQISALGSVDWAALRDWANRWRLNVVLRHALQVACGVLGAPWPVDYRDDPRPGGDRTSLRALEAYLSERRSRGGTTLAMLGAISGLRSKATYARMLLFPGRDFLDARGGPPGWPARVHRWRIVFRWVLGSNGRRS
jgi:hypothetical protein